MPARLLHQAGEIKDSFRAKIREKIEREKLEMRQRVTETVPSWIRWALQPVAEWSFDARHTRDEARGRDGEWSASLHFWLLLPSAWTVINDVVLEPEPDEFIQIDHVLVGPPGMFLVETKAWEGAFLGYRDTWKRKEGNAWVLCESPTKQNMRHKRLFLEWLNGRKLSLPGAGEHVTPVVLFTRAKWLKVESCSMPVFNGGLALAGYLRRRNKEQILPAEQADQVANALIAAKPLCTEFGVQQIESVEVRDKKRCIRVLGSQEQTEAVREMYIARGKAVSRAFVDKYDSRWWCFYVG